MTSWENKCEYVTNQNIEDGLFVGYVSNLSNALNDSDETYIRTFTRHRSQKYIENKEFAKLINTMKTHYFECIF